MGDAGIIDKDTDRDFCRDKATHGLFHAFRVCHVKEYRYDGYLVAIGEPGAPVPEFGRIPAGMGNDVCSAADKLFHHSFTDATIGSRDERGLSFKHYCLL